MKKISKISNGVNKTIVLIFFVFIVFLLILVDFSFGLAPKAKQITWGVNFSQKHAQALGLNWKETYLAILEDLGAKNLKISTHWDLIEPVKGKYNFQDLDWQIQQAEKKGAKLLLVIGMKTPRWPECHIPEWAKNLEKEKQQEKVLNLIEKIVLRYRDSKIIKYWQIENEPFFPFGECPEIDENFVKKEISLVKSLDQARPIIISDTGEFSFWVRAARLGDVVGITIYKKVWFKELNNYISYPFSPIFYWLKSQFVEKFFNKKVICVELQAEPWGPVLLYDLPFEEQKRTMNLEQFRRNIDFARKTGFNEFYLWGAEWAYWLKVKQNQPEIWNEAKKLF